MMADWFSEVSFKYDRMRILVYELLHYTLKQRPDLNHISSVKSASERLAVKFVELLERQFPVEETGNPLQLVTPSDFANTLSVHVNHLNKIMKETFGKSTSVIIHERIVLEAKLLLKHSSSDVSEIAFALGFKENTHFNNFFKKHLGITPTQFRKI